MSGDPDEVQFTDTQEKLYNLLYKAFGKDVKIKDMYYALYGVPDAYTSIRDMQQKLAPIISRVNKKMFGQEIKPGELKQTYRLSNILP